MSQQFCSYHYGDPDPDILMGETGGNKIQSKFGEVGNLNETSLSTQMIFIPGKYF